MIVIIVLIMVVIMVVSSPIFSHGPVPSLPVFHFAPI
jgi:hypothetical protein